jgi:hypothetical protein
VPPLRRGTVRDSALWTCPPCGRSFANRSQTHSCGRYTVDAFLQRRSPREWARLDAFRLHVVACGPVRLSPAKTRVGIQLRMIFAAVNALRPDRLDVQLLPAGGPSTRASTGSR